MDPFKKSLGINFGPLFSVANRAEVPVSINSNIPAKPANNEKKNSTQLQSSSTLEPPSHDPFIFPDKPGIKEIMGYYVIGWTWDAEGGYWVPVLGNPVRSFPGGGGGTTSGGYPPGYNPSGRGASSGRSSGGSLGRPARGTSDPDEGGSPMGVRSTVRRNPNQPRQTGSRITRYISAERPFSRPMEYFESELDLKEKYATLLKFGKHFGWTLEKIVEARKKKPNFEWDCDKNLNPDQHFCCPEHVQQAINNFYQSLFDDPMIQRNPKFLQCLSENWSKTSISCMPDSLYQEDERKQSRYDPNDNYNDFALARNGFLRIPVDSIVTWNMKPDGSTVAEINSKYKNELISQLLARCTQLEEGVIDALTYRASITLVVMGISQGNPIELLTSWVNDNMKNWLKERGRYWNPCTDQIRDGFYVWNPKTGTVWMSDKNGYKIEPPIISNDPAWKWPC